MKKEGIDDEVSKISVASHRSEGELLSKFSLGTGMSGDLPVDTEAIMRSFTEQDEPTSFGNSSILAENHDVFDSIDAEIDNKYGNIMMEDLDLQLIDLRRPVGREYGDDEASL